MRYEYKTIEVFTLRELNSVFDEYTAAGWRVVTGLPNLSDGYVIILEKRMPEERFMELFS